MIFLLLDFYHKKGSRVMLSTDSIKRLPLPFNMKYYQYK
ncbi:hypothetical protein BN4901_3552 [Citrobacter europaeus]|uniref:Uncharacterized protein n=1 Tax=Citrobacter europaeus TaxID=1914243 RepID=A0ABY0JSP6_9ENTR|nr:hypothetical protein CIP106467_2191 [Citrobacter europaeus]SBW26867.1 hypothetical protein BN4901_3552 [Citrobacter europaeus]